jgi:hypothetical protein
MLISVLTYLIERLIKLEWSSVRTAKDTAKLAPHHTITFHTIPHHVVIQYHAMPYHTMVKGPRLTEAIRTFDIEFVLACTHFVILIAMDSGVKFIQFVILKLMDTAVRLWRPKHWRVSRLRHYCGEGTRRPRCTHTHTHTHTHTCVHVRTHLHICTHTHTHIHSLNCLSRSSGIVTLIAFRLIN